ncbi:MAG: DUF1552 domain-containing protein [Bryobacterales bacterium]
MPRRLNRRTLLRGAGVALGLPYLEAMAATTGKPAAPAKRFCSFYFPYGVSLPKEDSDEAKWRWFPTGGERDFQLSYALEPLASVRDDVTILQGLSHPKGRTMGAHDTADTFLTGSSLEGKFLKNTVSVDQVIAAKIGHQTRYSSLVLSTDGGVGEPSRSSTLSFNENGHPIPSLNSPRTVFERLFGAGDSAEQRRTLGSSASMLDRVLEDSARLRSTLGGQDKAKLDEYLESVRQVEQRVERSQAWLDIPRPELTDADREMLQLDADDEAPGELMRTIYDLIYLALRTDSTRVVTYQIGSMGDYSSKAGKFPQLLGYNGTLHSLAHDWNKPGGARSPRQVGPLHGLSIRRVPGKAALEPGRRRHVAGQHVGLLRQQQQPDPQQHELPAGPSRWTLHGLEAGPLPAVHRRNAVGQLVRHRFRSPRRHLSRSSPTVPATSPRSSAEGAPSHQPQA